MRASEKGDIDPLRWIDRILALTPQEDPRHPLLLSLRKKIMEESLGIQKTREELVRLNQVVEKVTAPANRVGTFLGFPDGESAHIAVGGSDYFASLDPRLSRDSFRVGERILINEAFVVLRNIGYDFGGPVLKVTDLLTDGRIRAGQEPGAQSFLLIRSTLLSEEALAPGDEVRVDASHRVALEKLARPRRKDFFLDETPQVSWDGIGGQKEAIAAIRKTIEQPLLYPEIFKKFNYAPPKGFLLYGPPGCGKTLIGKATAGSLVQKLRDEKKEHVEEYFLHIKGPEILNMWLGESERMVRDIFAKAREKRGSGYYPVIFIDEAESILGTRRSSRALNISNTLVPMFCAEMDGIESLRDTVIILASNRPDLIDPAILRPGRIDRKIKIVRPGRNESKEIFGIYLKDEIPLLPSWILTLGEDRETGREKLIMSGVDSLFSRSPESRVAELHLRNGRRQIFYRSDILSGAMIASIITRAKEKAIQRAVSGGDSGLCPDDIILSIDEEYHEGDILPPNDILDDWLKLLDYDPGEVTGISLLDEKRRAELERRVI